MSTATEMKNQTCLKETWKIATNTRNIVDTPKGTTKFSFPEAESERERGGGGERESERERERERETETETERQRERQIQTDRQTDRDRDQNSTVNFELHLWNFPNIFAVLLSERFVKLYATGLPLSFSRIGTAQPGWCVIPMIAESSLFVNINTFQKYFTRLVDSLTGDPVCFILVWIWFSVWCICRLNLSDELLKFERGKSLCSTANSDLWGCEHF